MAPPDVYNEPKRHPFTPCILLHFMGKEDGATILALVLREPPPVLPTLPPCSPDLACFLE